jgi:hypothetical protein
MVVHKIKLPGRIHGGARDGKESVFQLLNACARRQHRRGIGTYGSGRFRRNVEHGELPLAHFQMMGHILNRIFVRELADAKKCAAAILVAGCIPALCVDMHIAEMNVTGVIKSNCRRKGARERVTR